MNYFKKCSKCQTVKLEQEFHKNKRRYDGLCNYCKDCRKQYYRENIDYNNEYHEKYRENNKEHILERQKLYYLNNIEKRKQYNKKHSQEKRTLPGYNSWHSMIQRCTNSSRKDYCRYGGRGIKVCERWLGTFGKLCIDGYERFIEDMGLPPKNLIKPSIDRMDPNGDYCPENCQWLSFSENSKKARKEK